MTRSLPVLVLLLSAVMWGLIWWPLKQLSAAGISGLQLVMVSYGGVGLLLAIYLWRERARWRGAAHYLLWIALLGGYANLAFALAMIHGEVVRAMMLFYLGPMWGVLGGWLLLGEAITKVRWWGMAAALLGVWLILGGNNQLIATLTWLDLLALTAGIAFALNNITFRASHALPIRSKVAAMFIGCGVMALVLLFVQGGESIMLTPMLGWTVTAYSLFWLLAATLATQWAVTQLEAGRAALLLVAELVVAVLSAALVGGEVITTLQLCGGALILVAALLDAAGESRALP